MEKQSSKKPYEVHRQGNACGGVLATLLILGMIFYFVIEIINLENKNGTRIEKEESNIPYYELATKNISFKDNHNQFNLFLTLGDNKTLDPFNNPYFELKA